MSLKLDQKNGTRLSAHAKGFVDLSSNWRCRMKLRRPDLRILLTMRQLATYFVLLAGLCLFPGLPAYAQNKTACELLSKADAEAVLGVTLQPPKPTAPFRSLLDPDFTKGTPE